MRGYAVYIMGVYKSLRMEDVCVFTHVWCVENKTGTPQTWCISMRMGTWAMFNFIAHTHTHTHTHTQSTEQHSTAQQRRTHLGSVQFHRTQSTHTQTESTYTEHSTARHSTAQHSTGVHTWAVFNFIAHKAHTLTQKHTHRAQHNTARHGRGIHARTSTWIIMTWKFPVFILDRNNCLRASLEPLYTTTSTLGAHRSNSRDQFVIVERGAIIIKGPGSFLNSITYVS